jgi:hypothetical protein
LPVCSSQESILALALSLLLASFLLSIDWQRVSRSKWRGICSLNSSIL